MLLAQLKKALLGIASPYSTIYLSRLGEICFPLHGITQTGQIRGKVSRAAPQRTNLGRVPVIGFLVTRGGIGDCPQDIRRLRKVIQDQQFGPGPLSNCVPEQIAATVPHALHTEDLSLGAEVLQFLTPVEVLGVLQIIRLMRVGITDQHKSPILARPGHLFGTPEDQFITLIGIAAASAWGVLNEGQNRIVVCGQV